MSSVNRRTIIKKILAGSAGLTILPGLLKAENVMNTFKGLKGNVNHSVCRWCFQSLPLDQLCKEVKKMGITAIDLVGPKDWPTLKAHGLHSSMCNGAEITLMDGFNDLKLHDRLIKQYTEVIPLVAEAGYKNLICFSGNRRGLDDETGLQNCVKGLKPLIPLAEKHKVVLVMELLNSKINHPDYQCDKTSWGVELAKRIGSENFKLLYDIYHMQVNEGDVINNIQASHQYIAHYHTAGVPGRHEIDETQELNYPAIMRAIVATGFKGYVAQEFKPTRKQPLDSLKQAIKICDV